MVPGLGDGLKCCTTRTGKRRLRPSTPATQARRCGGYMPADRPNEGLKGFQPTAITIAGIKLMHRIHNDQFGLPQLLD